MNIITILITGGTVFASRFTAEYFVKKGHDIYVINRNTKPQSEGVHLIECDRHNLDDRLKNIYFDLVIDVTAYNENDVSSLISSLGDYGKYIFISSSAVYPETLPQPFNEKQICGANKYWGDYGTNKIEAEKYLLTNTHDVYILRPPYLYGRMNNLYREAFVFDCADQDRIFYIPKDGKMSLQFFDIEDMCKFIEILINKQPEQHIFNVGNSKTVDINEWVKLCYGVLNKEPNICYIDNKVNQRDYFPFLDYEYVLDVSEMNKLMNELKPLETTLKESYEWYKDNRNQVRKKPLMQFIDENLKK